MLAQTIASIVNTSVEEGSATASVEETLVAHPTLELPQPRILHALQYLKHLL